MLLNCHMYINMMCVSSSKSSLAAPPLVEAAFTAKLRSIHHHHHKRHRHSTIAAFAGGSFSLNPMLRSCETCRGKGAIECPGCKGTGKNKKNGNIFERWKCFDCQGFGLKSCPSCGKGGGLTPEQRGER